MAYLTCLQTGDNGADGTHLFKAYPNILGDRCVLCVYVYTLQEWGWVGCICVWCVCMCMSSTCTCVCLTYIRTHMYTQILWRNWLSWKLQYSWHVELIVERVIVGLYIQELLLSITVGWWLDFLLNCGFHTTTELIWMELQTCNIYVHTYVRMYNHVCTYVAMNVHMYIPLYTFQLCLDHVMYTRIWHYRVQGCIVICTYVWNILDLMTVMNVLPKCFPHCGTITPFNLPGTFVYTSIDRYALYQW